jgi:acetyl-CoA carboxylase carboxyl transferase subunit alpha
MLRVNIEEAPDNSPIAVELHPAWRRVLLARHAKRPHSLDYIGKLIAGFEEIHGDRSFADDPAIVAGFGTFEGRPVVVAEQKGRDTKQKLYRNFGMPKPDGYRKALRVMQDCRGWRGTHGAVGVA